MAELIRVLVVDDSAYVRKVVSQMLSRSPFIEVVGIARDGQEALELAKELAPDVITCDLNMPVMDGVAFVRAQMGRQPVPIVIISIAAESGEQVLAALDAGAVDFVQKPTALATEKLVDIARRAGREGEGRRIVARASNRDAPPPRHHLWQQRCSRSRGVYDVVVIGVSTGGPQGLKAVIPQLPADFRVPVAMVLHMPIGYTEMYARKLDALSAPARRRGGRRPRGRTRHGVSRAGREASASSDATKQKVFTHLDVRPLDTPHRPSVDVLFQSAAEVYGGRMLGVVMTGMGSDGREGAAWIKAQGGCILTEAEETCVVYGMPRSVVEAGLSDERVPLDRMARAIMESI